MRRSVFPRLPSGPLLDRLRPIAKESLAEVAIWCRSRHSGRLMSRYANRTGLKLNLGCGDDIRPGWLNVDFAATPEHLPPGADYIPWDLRRGLPISGDTCRMVHTSHLLEHLSYQDGARLLRDCYRVLHPGGVLRLSLPDFRALFSAYLAGNQEYFYLMQPEEVRTSMNIEKDTASLVDLINFVVYQHGEHRSIYDAEKLELLLRFTGFSTIRVMKFSPDLDPTAPVRQAYSVYFEAQK